MRRPWRTSSRTVGAARVGMLIGLELWLPDQARAYGEDGAHIIAIPRADRSGDSDGDKASSEWLAGGRAAASASGAYCISSSRGGHGHAVGGRVGLLPPMGKRWLQHPPTRLSRRPTSISTRSSVALGRPRRWGCPLCRRRRGRRIGGARR